MGGGSGEFEEEEGVGARGFLNGEADAAFAVAEEGDGEAAAGGRDAGEGGEGEAGDAEPGIGGAEGRD